MEKTDGPSQKRLEELEKAKALREQVRDRLEDEDELDLARRLERCSERLTLHCTQCGTTKEIENGCKNKWCPVCQRRIAAKRSAKYALAVGLMEWPLFITLTMPHSDEDYLPQLRKLKRGFGKLRRRRCWTAHTRGGVAGLEVNSRSGEFHPHLHSVIDCKWLSAYVRPPQRGDTKAVIRAKCLAASDEVGLEWARCLGIKSMNPDWCGVIFKVKRCDKEGIQREILKYSIKGQDLIDSAEPIGPVIRALQATRLVTSFGSCYGKCRADDGATKPKCTCKKCGGEEWMIDQEVERNLRDAREGGHRR